MNHFRIFFGLCLVILFCSSVAAYDIQQGIHGMQWGSSISEYDDLIQVHENNQAAYYVNTQRLFHTAGQPISRVSYGFYRGRFYAAFIKLRSQNQFSRLSQKFKEKYGNPKISYHDAGKQMVYRWKVADVKIKLKMRESAGAYKLAFYYAPLSAKLTRDQLEQIPAKAYGPAPSNEDKNIQSAPLLDY